ncbi:hypothetical protein [Methylobacterium oryzae]
MSAVFPDLRQWWINFLISRDLDAWVPDPAERRIVLAETPAELFRFDR